MWLSDASDLLEMMYEYAFIDIYVYICEEFRLCGLKIKLSSRTFAIPSDGYFMFKERFCFVGWHICKQILVNNATSDSKWEGF